MINPERPRFCHGPSNPCQDADEPSWQPVSDRSISIHQAGAYLLATAEVPADCAPILKDLAQNDCDDKTVLRPTATVKSKNILVGPHGPVLWMPSVRVGTAFDVRLLNHLLLK